MKNILNFFTKDIPSFIHKDYLITFSVLLFLVFTVNKLWLENTTISILILLIIMILLILSAVGPQSLLNFIFEQTSNGTKLSFNRHIPTKEEKEFAIEAEYLNIHDLENREIYERSINRGFKEKSDFDFLIIATKLWREKKLDEALEQAYFGLYISNDYKIKSLLTMRIGTIFSDLEKDEFAKDKYSKAISIDSENSKAYNNLSICYMNENNFQKAKKFIFQSLELNKQNFNTYNILGVLYSRHEFEECNHKTAEEYLLKSIDLKPKENKPYTNISVLYIQEDFKEYNKAKKYLLEAKHNDEKDLLTLSILALLYSTKEFEDYNLNKTEKYLLEAYNIDKTNPDISLKLGKLYSNKDFKKYDLKQAEKYLSEALSNINNSSEKEELLNNIGYFYFNLKELNTAKDYFLEAYYNKKDAPHINDSLGEVYMELGDFELSEKYFKKAIELDNQNILYYKNIIKLYDKFDKEEEKLEIQNELEKIQTKKINDSNKSNSSSQEPQ